MKRPVRYYLIEDGGGTLGKVSMKHCRATIGLLGRTFHCRLGAHHEKEGRRKLHVANIRLKLPEQKLEMVVIRWRKV